MQPGQGRARDRLVCAARMAWPSMFSTPVREEVRDGDIVEDDEGGSVARCCCSVVEGFDLSMLGDLDCG